MTNAVWPDWSTTFNIRSSRIKLQQFHSPDWLSVFSSIAKNRVSAFGTFTLYWNLFSDLPSTGNQNKINKYKYSSSNLSHFFFSLTLCVPKIMGTIRYILDICEIILQYFSLRAQCSFNATFLMSYY